MSSSHSRSRSGWSPTRRSSSGTTALSRPSARWASIRVSTTDSLSSSSRRASAWPKAVSSQPAYAVPRHRSRASRLASTAASGRPPASAWPARSASRENLPASVSDGRDRQLVARAVGQQQPRLARACRAPGCCAAAGRRSADSWPRSAADRRPTATRSGQPTAPPDRRTPPDGRAGCVPWRRGPRTRRRRGTPAEGPGRGSPCRNDRGDESCRSIDRRSSSAQVPRSWSSPGRTWSRSTSRTGTTAMDGDQGPDTCTAGNDRGPLRVLTNQAARPAGDRPGLQPSCSARAPRCSCTVTSRGRRPSQSDSTERRRAMPPSLRVLMRGERQVRHTGAYDCQARAALRSMLWSIPSRKRIRWRHSARADRGRGVRRRVRDTGGRQRQAAPWPTCVASVGSGAQALR